VRAAEQVEPPPLSPLPPSRPGARRGS